MKKFIFVTSLIFGLSFVLSAKNFVFAACEPSQCPSCPSGYFWHNTYKTCCQDTQCNTSVDPSCNNCSSDQHCVMGEGCQGGTPPQARVDCNTNRQSCSNTNECVNRCINGDLHLWYCPVAVGSGSTGTCTYLPTEEEKNPIPCQTDENCWQIMGSKDYYCRELASIGGHGTCSSKFTPGERYEEKHAPHPIKPETCGPEEKEIISTAIGCIPTNPQALMVLLLPWAMGLGGGIAFLFMLFAAFQILTSAGNPEKLKAGQEMLTNAIIGLLFVIFSTFLLRVIGIPIMFISTK